MEKSEWDIFVNPQGVWCYRWQHRFANVKFLLGKKFNIVHANHPGLYEPRLDLQLKIIER